MLFFVFENFFEHKGSRRTSFLLKDGFLFCLGVQFQKLLQIFSDFNGLIIRIIYFSLPSAAFQSIFLKKASM
jgi:hypothetical protein